MQRTVLVVVLLAFSGIAAADSKDQKIADVHFVVVKEENGKPIRNASVVLHQVNSRGRQAKGGVELKTDSDGKASFNGIPYGKLRVQVIVPGFQTYGVDHEVNQPQQEFVVKLKRPQQQYTIYK